jgi:hypothetical protein
MKIVLACALGGGAGLVELGSSHLRALLTPESIEFQSQRPGREVFAIIKATSIACLGTG